MQQDEALGLLEAFTAANGLEAPQEKSVEVALEEQPPIRPGDDWDPELQFRFFPDTGELKWYALIYEFPDPPSDRLLEACQDEEDSGKADMGGGTLEYDPEHQTLHLVRTYQEVVPVEQLSADVMALQLASQTWGDEVLERAFFRARSS
jgi:hypothetical protein